MILNKNNNIKKKIIIPFSILSITTLLSLIGKSSYVLPGNEIDLTIKEDKDVKPVCYIDSNKDIKYTSIEKALKVAKNDNNVNVINVYPGVSYTITKECVLGENDALIIPYSEDNSIDKLTEDVENSGFADNKKDTYRKCLVKLANKLTLMQNSTLGICGKTGGTGPQGGTNGDYAELQFLDGGYIDCYGLIKCYGYIHDSIEKNRKEDDVAIYVHEGAKVGEPLAMYDWGSSSNSLNKMKHEVFPINVFDLPNIRAPMNFDYGSQLTAFGHIYGSNPLVGHRKASGEIISKDNDEGFLQLQSGSSILINFDSQQDLLTDQTYTNHSLFMRSKGNINISAVVVSLSGYELDSKKYYLPISGIYHLNVLSGKCIVKYKTKFLPGSELEVASNAQVEFLNNVTFYSSKKSNNVTIPSYNFNNGANFINNGELHISKGFDGKIINNIDNSIIEVAENYNIISDSYESDGNKKYGPFQFGGGQINLADDINGVNVSFKNVTKSSKYKSINKYYYKLDEIVRTFKIDPDNGKSDAGKENTYTLKANLTPLDGLKNVEYHWECNGGYFNNDKKITQITAQQVTYTTPKNESTSDDLTYYIHCYATYVDENGDTIKTSQLTATFIATKTDSGCITSNTLILMSNGTYKKAIDIRANDLVMSINHETGKIEPTPIVFNDHIDKEADIYDVLSLEFSNDKTVEIVYEHGFFDLDTNKYEYITLDNYQSFIGHRFVSVDYINGKFIKGIATLNKGYITNKFTRICSPVTYKNLNIITENMLSMPGGISGLFNIFEYDKNLAYDQVKENEDINKYGLLDYSYFNNLIPYEVYEAFNGKYLKVAMGKGILTKKLLNNYIERYLPIITKQNNCH
ncbi:MAG TPA: hypothetical protein DEA28_01580 [Firmicutes bacterium]|nr:hypothetical protein [Bacillota bacterium]